jgi:NADH:ubiquinone reductase (H+-translocating)
MSGAPPENSPRVVILGAGFGGIAAARALASVPVHTTIVDRNYYNTFQPLLYQVATGGLNAGDVAYPVRNLLRRRHALDFRWGTVERVDADKRAVFLGDGTELRYDFLIIATGATINYFGVPGAAEHAQAIYTLDDALAVRRRMFEQFEHAVSAGGEGGVLNVVIVGGGPTGVEMAGALAELRTLILDSSYPSLDPQMGSVLLVEQKEALLGGFEGPLAAYAQRELTRRGVEVRLSTAVREVSAGGLTINSGEEASTFLPAGLVVWAAGVAASSVAASSELALTAHGRIEVGPNLAIPGRPEVFAIGDVAATPAPGGGHPLAQLAQPAIQGGHHAAREISAALSGAQPTPFSYKDKGIMATIGRRSAVAEIALPATRRLLPLRGTPAWFAWLGLHIYFLLGGRNRAAVLLNWAWRYVSWRRGPRVIVGG